MSLAILAMVLTTIGISGAVRQEDEGTQAHIFQIWLVLEVVLGDWWFVPDSSVTG
jgi:hypothetical protein